MSFITPEGGLTNVGYGLFIITGIIALLFGSFVAGKVSSRKKMTAKQLVFCAMAIALGFVTSYIRLFKMPWGGSVTLFSMLFITLVGYWYGLGTGILVGLSFGILQFLQEPYFLTFWQVCCDYLLAFAALGFSGFFRNRKNGLRIGYLAGVIGRGIFASIAGYMYWMSYMPDNFPKSLSAIYPIAYNFAYLGIEAVLTFIVLSVPAVSKALEQIRKMALDEA